VVVLFSCTNAIGIKTMIRIMHLKGQNNSKQGN